MTKELTIWEKLERAALMQRAFQDRDYKTATMAKANQITPPAHGPEPDPSQTWDEPEADSQDASADSIAPPR